MPKVIPHSERYFALRRSTIADAGRGLFIRQKIAKGDRLRVVGFLVKRGSTADRCTHYADPYKFRVGKDLLIPSGYGALVNHSLKPNVKKVISRGNVFLEAVRAIAAGEELFHCYSHNALKRFRRRPRQSRATGEPARDPLQKARV